MLNLMKTLVVRARINGGNGGNGGIGGNGRNGMGSV